jgi:hypothetical protein
MKIPKSVVISGVKYTVEQVPALFTDENDRLAGRINYNLAEIKLEKGNKATRKKALRGNR